MSSCDFSKREDITLTDDQHTELYASTAVIRKAFLDKLLEAFKVDAATQTCNLDKYREARKLEEVYKREFHAKLEEILSRPVVVKEEKKETYTGFARHA